VDDAKDLNPFTVKLLRCTLLRSVGLSFGSRGPAWIEQPHAGPPRAARPDGTPHREGYRDRPAQVIARSARAAPG